MRFKTHLRILVAISVAAGALAAWAADQINLMQLIERLAGLFGVLMLVVLLALPQVQAQTFEIGYELALEPPVLAPGHVFLYATHDFFLFEFERLDTQVYFSPSAEIVFGDRWQTQAQFLIDAPIATLSARAIYYSSGRLESPLGLLITPFDQETTMSESSDLIVWRLERIEEKLDEVLKEHEQRIDSLEHHRTGQKSRNAVFTAIGVPLLGLSLRDLWLLWFGR